MIFFQGCSSCNSVMLEVFFPFQVYEVSRGAQLSFTKTTIIYTLKTYFKHLFPCGLWEISVRAHSGCSSSASVGDGGVWEGTKPLLWMESRKPLTRVWWSGYPCREMDLGADKCFCSFLSCTDLSRVLRPNQHQVRVDPSVSSFSFSLRG